MKKICKVLAFVSLGRVSRGSGRKTGWLVRSLELFIALWGQFGRTRSLIVPYLFLLHLCKDRWYHAADRYNFSVSITILSVCLNRCTYRSMYCLNKWTPTYDNSNRRTKYQALRFEWFKSGCVSLHKFSKANVLPVYHVQNIQRHLYA